MDKTIIKCPSCKRDLRIPILEENTKLRVKCPCGKSFEFDLKKYLNKRKRDKQKFLIFAASCGLFALSFPLVAHVGIQQFDHRLEFNRDQQQKNLERGLGQIKLGLDKELGDVSPSDLKATAEAHYVRIWGDRKNYDQKYAITPREKAFLAMSELSKDKTKPMEDIVRSLAERAAPSGSEIRVETTREGFLLDIDFDMSSLASEEKGSKTKHQSIESLRDEVRRLIYKVMSDIYQFTQDVDLQSIQIGCRHVVNTYTNGVSSGEQNIVLYKVKLDKKNLKDLMHNPFLGIYSTGQYCEVVLDDFPNLELSKSHGA